MAVPFSNTKLRVPPGFPNILEALAREVLRYQPENIYKFSEEYLLSLIEKREASGEMDLAVLGATLDDRYYNNKSFSEPQFDANDPNQQKAAVTIQSEYRRHAAEKDMEGRKQVEAATVIQSTFRGYKDRVAVATMKKDLMDSDGLSSVKSELMKRDGDDDEWDPDKIEAANIMQAACQGHYTRHALQQIDPDNMQETAMLPFSPIGTEEEETDVDDVDRKSSAKSSKMDDERAASIIKASVEGYVERLSILEHVKIIPGDDDDEDEEADQGMIVEETVVVEESSHIQIDVQIEEEKEEDETAKLTSDEVTVQEEQEEAGEGEEEGQGEQQGEDGTLAAVADETEEKTVDDDGGTAEETAGSVAEEQQEMADDEKSLTKDDAAEIIQATFRGHVHRLEMRSNTFTTEEETTRVDRTEDQNMEAQPAESETPKDGDEAEPEAEPSVQIKDESLDDEETKLSASMEQPNDAEAGEEEATMALDNDDTAPLQPDDTTTIQEEQIQNEEQPPQSQPEEAAPTNEEEAPDA